MVDEVGLALLGVTITTIFYSVCWRIQCMHLTSQDDISENYGNFRRDVGFYNSSVNLNGGSMEAYPAGQLPHALSSVEPHLVSIKEVKTHFAGFWGNELNIFLYPYTTVITDREGSKTYKVDCYCIVGERCSCDKVYDPQYFNTLPLNIAVSERFSNYTRLYINGTEETNKSLSWGNVQNSISAASSRRSRLMYGSKFHFVAVAAIIVNLL